MKRSFRLACITLLCGMGGTAATNADEQNTPSYDLDIDALPLMAAVKFLSDETGIEVLYFSEIAEGVTSRPVKGEFTPQEALETMLDRTDLEVVQLDQVGAVAIRPAGNRGGDSDSKNLNPTPVLMAHYQASEKQTGVSTETSNSPEDAESQNGPAAMSLEEIIVTGTNIRGVENPTVPVLTFDKEDIDLSGAATLEDFLRTIPQNFNSENVISADSANPFSNGNNIIQAAGVDLRGLGVGSTLTLLNGRRLAPVGQFSFIDVNILPLGAIERVDVQTDGASAIYGSDAVGGVVNFVTRKDYEGFEVNARYGTVTSGSKEDFGVGAAGGFSWRSGGALIGLDYLEEKPLLSSERDFIDPSLLDENGTFGSETDRFSIAGSFRQELTSWASTTVDIVYSDRSATTVSNALPGLSLVRENEQEGMSVNSKLDLRISDDIEATIFADYGRNELSDTSSSAINGVVGTSVNDLLSFEGQLAGRLIELPGGAVSFAAGALYRQEAFEDSGEDNAGQVTRGLDVDREVTAAYAEILAPIIGRNNSLPLIQGLQFSAAVRYEDYSDFSDTFDPKIGLYWEVNDQLSFRGSYSSSFRVPSLVTANSAQGYIATVLPASIITTFEAPEPDPRLDGTVFEGSIVTLLPTGGGNPDLSAETADTWSAGFTYEPSFIDGLSVEGNFFDISYDNRLEGVFFREILQIPAFVGLAEFPPNQARVENIFAAGEAGEFEFSTLSNRRPDFPFDISPEDVQLFLNAGFQNLSERDTKGVDFNFAYTKETTVGRFSGRLNLVYTFDFIGRVTEIADAAEQVNLLYRPIELNLRGNVGWSNNGFTAIAAVNHTGGYRDSFDRSNANDIDPWTTIDVSLSYDTQERFNSPTLDNTRIALNVQNIFDEDPPFVETEGGFNFDAANADPFGRILTLSLRKQF